jgi:hypothetical protein
MTWLSTFFVAVLTAAAGAFSSGLIAALAVDWYNVPSREGESGYFVIAFGLLGLLVGLLLGIVVSRTVAGGTHPGFLKALGVSFAILLGAVGSVGGVARLLADVPPEIDGETLLLAVEVRWPAEHASSPATDTSEGYLRLHSIPAFSHTVRKSVRGPLWKSDAKLVDGRWVVPGAVEVFTGRGMRMLEVALDDTTSLGFQVPLPGRPGKKDLQWSDWLPRLRPGAPPLPHGITFRFRAQRTSEPIRRETIGSFEVLTVASSFSDVTIDGKTTSAAYATFRLNYRGKPLAIEGPASASDGSTAKLDAVDAVAALTAPKPSLLVHGTAENGNAYCYLLSDDGERLHVDYVGEWGTSGIPVSELTSDTARFRAGRHREVPAGRIDRKTFDHGALYLVENAVLDTRDLTIHRFREDSTLLGTSGVPPLALSPDERSFVRYDMARDSGEVPLLGVIDFVADRAYTLPIDAARMRYATLDALDPAWVEHHFTWKHEGGADRLVERSNFTPLPYRGEFEHPKGSAPTYRLEKAGEEVRQALIDFLVREFSAERIPSEPGAYEQTVRIGNEVLSIAAGSQWRYVLLSAAPGSTDTTLVADVAKRFDAALATGKYDALFGEK